MGISACDQGPVLNDLAWVHPKVGVPFIDNKEINVSVFQRSYCKPGSILLHQDILEYDWSQCPDTLIQIMLAVLRLCSLMTFAGLSASVLLPYLEFASLISISLYSPLWVSLFLCLYKSNNTVAVVIISKQSLLFPHRYFACPPPLLLSSFSDTMRGFQSLTAHSKKNVSVLRLWASSSAII